MQLPALNWTGVHADSLRKALGADRNEFARWLGVRRREVRAWEDATAAHDQLSRLVTRKLQRKLTDLDSAQLAAFYERAAEISQRAVLPAPVEEGRELPPLLAAWSLSTGAPRKSALPASADFLGALLTWRKALPRRDLLAVLAATVAAFQVMYPDDDPTPLNRQLTAASGVHRVDAELLSGLWVTYWACRQNDDALGPRAALATAAAQHTLTASLLVDCPPQHRAEMLVLLSSWSATLAWLYFDLHDHERSRYFHDMAISTAREAGSPHAAAMAFGNRAYLVTTPEDRAVSKETAAAALDAARRSGDPQLEAFAAARMAYACSAANESYESHRLLAFARDRLDLPQSEPRSVAYFADHAFVLHTDGDCGLVLNDPKRAVVSARAALDLHPQAFVRNRALNHVRLATGLIRDRQPEEACTHAWNAALLATVNTSPRLLRNIRVVRKELDVYANTQAVQDLDAALHDLGLLATA